MSINGARTAVALVVIGLYLWAIRHKPRMNRWVLLGALAVCGTNILFSIANKMTTAANAIVLQFTAPIFVMVFTAIFFRRRPGKLDLVTCAAVLGGILFFFVDSLSAGGMVGNVLALISGISYAGVFMMNDMPEGDAISSVFWGDVFSAVVGLPFVAMETDLSATAVVSVLILGVFQVALAYILLTIGLKTTPPVTASLVSGIEPVLNPILVAVFYHGNDRSHCAGGRGDRGGQRGGLQCDLWTQGAQGARACSGRETTVLLKTLHASRILNKKEKVR